MEIFNVGGPHQGCLEKTGGTCLAPASYCFLCGEHIVYDSQIKGMKAFDTGEESLEDIPLFSSFWKLCGAFVFSPITMVGKALAIPTCVGWGVKKIAVCTDKRSSLFYKAIKAYWLHQDALQKQYCLWERLGLGELMEQISIQEEEVDIEKIKNALSREFKDLDFSSICVLVNENLERQKEKLKKLLEKKELLLRENEAVAAQRKVEELYNALKKAEKKYECALEKGEKIGL